MKVITEKDIYSYTDQKLTAHFQNNEKFNQELGAIYEFYRDKLHRLTREEDFELLDNDLFESIKSQIFNGYHMGLELLTNHENNFSDDMFTNQTEGMMAQQLPDLLRNATNEDIEGIVTGNHLKKLISWLVLEYEDIYPLLLDISLNTACLGTKWAFLDEAEKRGLTVYDSKIPGIIAQLDDITFITPQDYITLQLSNDNNDSEVWEVISSSYAEYQKIGEVHVIRFLKNGNEYNYYMNIAVKSYLTIAEQQYLIDTLATRLMVLQDIERHQLILNASSVDEFYLIG